MQLASALHREEDAMTFAFILATPKTKEVFSIEDGPAATTGTFSTASVGLGLNDDAACKDSNRQPATLPLEELTMTNSSFLFSASIKPSSPLTNFSSF